MEAGGRHHSLRQPGGLLVVVDLVDCDVVENPANQLVLLCFVLVVVDPVDCVVELLQPGGVVVFCCCRLLLLLLFTVLMLSF